MADAPSSAGRPADLLRRALLAIDELKARLATAERERQEPIAIVGMGCRLPGAPSPESFWQLLAVGGAPLREIPPDRWDVDAYHDPDPDAPGKMCTRVAAFLDRVDLFDPQFFGIAPREAHGMDPQQRLLLEVCWEALEHGAIAPDGLAGSATGVFLGIAAADYVEVAKAGDPRRIDAYHASGTAHSIASGRIAYVLGLQGPAVSVDTACSSSLVAVHQACQSLLARDCRMALAGGVNLILTPDNGISFTKAHMLAPDGRCKTFDADADGFGRGEGCAVIVLKRLSDALADGNRVLAVISGSALNQDGPSSGLTAPNGPQQQAVVREALQRAQRQPDEVDYIEAHGTGTSLGDPIEIQALAAVFGARGGRPLMVGSVKTNIGHLEVAAGISGLLKIVLSLQHEAIPPHLNLVRRNPHVDWESMHIDIPTRLTAWPRGARRRIAGVSSFGFSGTNAHVLLEEAPLPQPAGAAAERPQHLLTLSARSEPALAASVEALLAQLQSGAPVALADVAFSLNAGRARLPHRLALRAASMDEALTRLRHWRGDDPAIHRGTPGDGDKPRVAMLFTGQGAQYAGMGRQLFETQPVFRAAIEDCDRILRGHLDVPLLSVLYPAEGIASPIDETAYTQPALFAVDYALAVLWRSWGVEPSVVLGHSLGEFVAACVAGAITLEDALPLVATRGRLMQALPRNGGMAAIFASEGQVSQLLGAQRGQLSIAAVNEPGQIVVSGESTALQALLGSCAAAGIQTRPLTVSHAFHSPLMQPMLDEFTAAVRRVTFNPPRIPVISNVTGKVLDASELASPDYWRRHVLSAVRFADGIREALHRGITLFVEAGPHPVLLGMASRCAEAGTAQWIASLRRNQDDWSQLLDGLARIHVRGGSVDWMGFERGHARRRLALPTYPFERERYWVEAAPARRAVAAHELDHPLLGRRLHAATLREAIFEASTGQATWLREHRVHDVVIMPGAGLVEMGLAAAHALWGAGAHAVAELELRAALAVHDAPATTQLVVEPASDDGLRRQFRIFSTMGGPDPTWKLHATGTLVRTRDGAAMPDAESIAAISARCTQAQEVSAFYADVAARGIELGPAFRGITQILRCDGEALARIVLPAQAGRHAAYRIHPILLDNAIQALAAALLRDGDNVAFVPFSIGCARVHQPPAAIAAVFGHARVVGALGQDAQVIAADIRICDEAGRVLASLEGLRLKRTDATALRRSVGTTTDDWLYRVQWLPQALADTPAVACTPAELASTIEREADALAIAQGLVDYDAALPALESLALDYVVEAWRKLGWKHAPGERITTAQVIQRFDIVPAQQRLVGRLLHILAAGGYLRGDAGDWEVVKALEARDAAVALAALRTRPAADAELTLLAACGPHLAEVLRGVADPLDLLFPRGSASNAEALYQVSPSGRTFNQLIALAVQRIVALLPTGTRLRILEIGGGTGATAAHVLPHLPADRTQYVFTDISGTLAQRAAQKFAAWPFVECRTLDIERDPAAQGFDAHAFDLVIAANVLHATRELGETLRHVRQLLAPGGLLLMLELLQRQRWVDLTFGMTDGWWRFTDRQLRPDYPLLDAGGWQALLQREGFAAATSAPAARGAFSWQSVLLATTAATETSTGAWLLLADRGGTAQQLAASLAARGHQCTLLAAGADRAALRAALTQLTAAANLRGIVHLWALDDVPAPAAPVEVLERYERDLCGGVLDLVQEITAQRPVPLMLVTRGALPVTPESVTSAPAASLWGIGQAIALEHPELACRRIDLDPQRDTIDALVAELLAHTREDQVGLRGGLRHVARLARPAAPATPAVYRLESRERGAFERLYLAPATRRAPASDEVEIAVDATALNFADVMDALGVRPGGAAQFGGECAGTVVQVGAGVAGLAVGDAVLALAAGCHASHVTCRAELVLGKPAALSAAEAAALPIAALTARLALLEVAALRPGERVLIHAAAGGVGGMAVQMALRLGAEVFATAGSTRKRAWLAAAGVRHIMDSRSTDFARQVRELTGGAGVQVVLNSLSGEFIAASVSCLAQGGRFVEIGKTGWSAERFAALRADARYQVLDWWPMTRTAPAKLRALLEQTLADIARGELALPPLTAFDATDAPRAFRYMAQGQHIGKIVMRHARPASVHADASYLVTGGLGGLGLLAATRLAALGARSLVLMGRRPPAAGWAADRLAQLQRDGVRLTIVQGDVANAGDVATLFTQQLPQLPPLRGVVHSAGMLDDGVLQQQSRERFATVLAPKVAGLALLDHWTHALPLDFLIVFSSVAAVLGSPGQANHSAANACMDSLVLARRARGLAGSSINWGAWSEVGAAMRHDVGRRITQQGLGMIDLEGGLAVFESVLASGAPQTVVLPVDWRRYSEHAATHRPPLLADWLAQRPAAPPAPALRETSLQLRLEQTAANGRPRLILDFVREQALRILGLPASHGLGLRQPLNELGLDSLMAVELRNSLATSLGRAMPATLLFDYPTVAALSRYLEQELLGAPAAVQPLAAAAPAASIEGIEQLSDDEVERRLAARMAQRTQP